MPDDAKGPDGPPRDRPSGGPIPGSRRIKWHHIYYLLAAFDLATVSFSLLLTHRILDIYTASVEVNQEWAYRSAGYDELARLSSAVNAPGNDLFDSHAVAQESARLDAALLDFDRALDAARSDLKTNVEPTLRAPILLGLGRVDTAMSAMVDEARLIFRHYESDPEQAGRRMAEMDRKYSQVRSALEDVEGAVVEIQTANFEDQTHAALSISRYEYLVVSFIAVMVVGITIYGISLARKIEADQRERDSYLTNLQETEARTRAILDSAAEGTITTDDHGIIEAVNPAAERIFGWQAEELIGKNVSVLMAEPVRAEHDAYMARYREGGEPRIIGVGGREVLAERKDGTVFPLELAVSEVNRGDRGRLFTALLHDISDRKEVEELTRRYREELEQTVRERTAVLEEALAKQSELAQKNAQAYALIQRTQEELVRQERLAAVGELSAAVAHGLRNPLASIRACAEVERTERSDADSISETLDDIIGEVDRLEGRIRAVLDLARPSEPFLVPGDLNQAMETLVESLLGRTPPGVRIRLDLEPAIPTALFDAAQLHEVLEVVAVNALEAMGEEGELTLCSWVDAGHPGGATAVVSVKDTGPGLDEFGTQRIFDLFYTTKPSGTGIGLAIARRIVESQGGTIEVASRPGSGTSFEIRLPLRASERGSA
jgi:two-component system sensor kinase FixL